MENMPSRTASTLGQGLLPNVSWCGFYPRIFSLLTAVRLHDHIPSAQRAMALFRSLHHNHAADAEHMAAPKPDWLVADAEADRTGVITQLRDDGEDFIRQLSAHEFRHGLR